MGLFASDGSAPFDMTHMSGGNPARPVTVRPPVPLGHLMASVASSNLSTCLALDNDGYRNVCELAPQIDPAQTKLSFACKLAQK